MRFQFSFRHMEVSPALQNYAESKIQAQIDRFVSKAIEGHVTFTVDKHRHQVHCAIAGGDGFSLQVEHTSDDMYTSVDKLVDKIATQLKKKKDKLKDHKGTARNVSHLDFRQDAGDEGVELDAEDIIKFETAKKLMGAR